MKDFRQEFYKFRDKLANKEPFALSRCNDGEMIILENQYINLLNKCNGEFVYSPDDPSHAKYREKLLESATYVADNYYVGLACECCVGKEKHLRLKEITKLSENMLTFGNVFVNSNYLLYVNEMLPLFNNYNIVVVVNEKANINNLPFFNKIIKDFRVTTNAWIENYSMINELKEYIESNNIKNTLFLFCAGPFSNILILEAFKSSPDNFLLDVGSTLDVYLFGNRGYTRGYLCGAQTINSYCIWQ
jgi:hypothetical protein